MVKLSEINNALCKKYEVEPKDIKWHGIGTREANSAKGVFIYMDDEVKVEGVSIYCCKCFISGALHAALADEKATIGRKAVYRPKAKPCI